MYHRRSISPTIHLPNRTGTASGGIGATRRLHRLRLPRLTESQVRNYRVNNRARMRLKEIRSGTDKFHFLSIVERDKSIMEKVDNAVNKMLETERVCINGQMQPVNHNHRSPQ